MEASDVTRDPSEDPVKYKRLALNEIFVAEHNVCKTSIFQLCADEK